MGRPKWQRAAHQQLWSLPYNLCIFTCFANFRQVALPNDVLCFIQRFCIWSALLLHTLRLNVDLSGILHPTLHQCHTTLLFEYLLVIRYIDDTLEVLPKYRLGYPQNHLFVYQKIYVEDQSDPKKFNWFWKKLNYALAVGCRLVRPFKNHVTGISISVF